MRSNVGFTLKLYAPQISPGVSHRNHLRPSAASSHFGLPHLNPQCDIPLISFLVMETGKNPLLLETFLNDLQLMPTGMIPEMNFGWLYVFFISAADPRNRRPQSFVQAGYASLGELHMRPVRREGRTPQLYRFHGKTLRNIHSSSLLSGSLVDDMKSISYDTTKRNNYALRTFELPLVGLSLEDRSKFNPLSTDDNLVALHFKYDQARRRFVEWAQNEIAVVPDFHKRILFNDEAHFWLNGYVNKQNCRIWSEANPQVYVETPLHPEKLTVWCALWAGGILLQKR
ncbi:hypothetical protein TNCV_330721 [Trichonephila clavipes]|nr:hypothetical protein TNCV_330721 [Trichonephila clavipes]